VGGNRFSPADGINAFVGFRLEVNFLSRYAEGTGEGLTHFRKMRPHLGLFRDHYRVDVLDDKMFFIQELPSVLKEKQAVCAFPLGIGVGKMRAYVTKPGRAEKSITQCVRENVAIRMAYGSFFKGQLDATNNEFAPLREPVQIIAYAAARAHFLLRSSSK
jgi:hypothetical protein